PGVGMPLGNLTSQIFANVYLHELDWYVKHTLKAKNYTRYMDDFVIIHQNKNYLHTQRIAIQNFLQQHLKLKTNSKTQVFPIAKKGGRALDFLGYRIYSTHRLLRKSSVKSIKRKLKIFHIKYELGQVNLPEINQSVQSWIGHASHANSYNLRKKLLNQSFKRGDYV
ncbi:MAG: RNA-dependent DNA polymerase, partial [Rheinheimera sp.]|nr:RNA-dependent DNA polymerase [Rheinheimera sp.]